MNTDVLFSSARTSDESTDVWSTPQSVFDALNKEFGFTLDPCCNPENAKTKRFYTETDNGLIKPWAHETVFMNPPYSHVSKWMAKAYGSSVHDASIVVCLVPSRTDTDWWHKYAMRGEIRFIKGRLKFGDSENSAPFPSAIIVFRPSKFSLSDYLIK